MEIYLISRKKKIHNLTELISDKNRKKKKTTNAGTDWNNNNSSPAKFWVVGGLNPVQIENEDDRVVNMLKKHKNIIHKLIPLKILFPGSIKNDPEQVFVTSTEFNDVKKPLINSKMFGLLGITDLKKIIIRTK